MAALLQSVVKQIGFLSFGHYQPVPGSQVRTAADALTQAIDLSVAAEEIGVDGAYFRVHHFARQASAPFPLLAAIAARTDRIQLGTGVIDLRYENPLYLAEEAAETDLISAGRLQLGVSRGSPGPADRGHEAFGYVPAPGETDTDLAHRHLDRFLDGITGKGVAPADPAVTGSARPLHLEPLSPGLPRRIWWGSGTRRTAEWTARKGLNLMSSTLLTEDTGVPFHELQAEQISVFRSTWQEAGWDWTPRVSVSRSILPITTDEDRRYFGGSQRDSEDQVGYLDAQTLARFGKSYTGEPDALIAQLLEDSAIAEADSILLTVPNMLGVEYNIRLLETVLRDIAPALGWR